MSSIPGPEQLFHSSNLILCSYFARIFSTSPAVTWKERQFKNVDVSKMFWKISKGAFVKDRCSMSFQIFSTGAFTETFKVSENSYFSDNLWITPDEFWTYESYSFSVTVVTISWSLSYSINQKWHNLEN